MTERVRMDAIGLLKVAKAGFDVASAALPDLNFSPDYRMHRVVESGSLAFSSDDNAKALLVGIYNAPPRARYAIIYSSMSGGGFSGDRKDMGNVRNLIGSIIAATPFTDHAFSANRPSSLQFSQNTAVFTSLTEIRVNNRVGAGTVYYEILEDL